MAIAFGLTLAAVSPVAAQSCDDASGVWEASEGDLSAMTVERTGGCSFRATFTGVTGVGHVVQGTAGLGHRMTVTRTDTAGCVTQMYGSMFVATDGRTLWWSLDATDGRCGLAAGYSETRRFDLRSVREFYPPHPPRRPHEPHEPRYSEPQNDRRPAFVGPHVPAIVEPLNAVVEDTVEKLNQRNASDDADYEALQNKGRTRPSPRPSETPGGNREPSGGNGGGGNGDGGGNGAGNSDGCKSCGNGPR